MTPQFRFLGYTLHKLVNRRLHDLIRENYELNVEMTDDVFKQVHGDLIGNMHAIHQCLFGCINASFSRVQLEDARSTDTDFRYWFRDMQQTEKKVFERGTNKFCLPIFLDNWEDTLKQALFTEY